MRYDQRSETKGFISGVLHFANASELYMREFVDVSSGIDRFKYSYHYKGRLKFLYSELPIFAVM